MAPHTLSSFFISLISRHGPKNQSVNIPVTFSSRYHSKTPHNSTEAGVQVTDSAPNYRNAIQIVACHEMLFPVSIIIRPGTVASLPMVDAGRYHFQTPHKKTDLAP